MIYSASRRTDLPAFYPDYIASKIRRSRKLEAIVFWTKDPRNLVNHPELSKAIDAYPTIIQLTVTGLAGTAWEPDVPPPAEILPAIQALAARLPQGAVRWRFDPILVTDDLAERFLRLFRELRSSLGCLPSAVISFPAPYRKVTRRLQAAGLTFPPLNLEQKRACLKQLLSIARKEEPGFTFEACCQPDLLELDSVQAAACIDSLLFDRLYQTCFGPSKKDYGQRKECGCKQSTDIGKYEQTCHHHCLYCYAAQDSSSPAESRP